MKKIRRAILIIIMCMISCSCKTDQEGSLSDSLYHDSAENFNCTLVGHTVTVGVCGECGEMQNPELVSLIREKLSEVMNIGNELIECVSGVNLLPGEKQFDAFVKAEGYAADMNDRYIEIISSCDDVFDLTGLVYQVKLLQHAIPNKIQNSEPASLANQTVLYRLYLQQISSSFGYLSEYMKHLAGEVACPSEVLYYNEEKCMPTPDSCIYGIQYSSEELVSGTKQYIYTIGDDESDANLNYNIYLKAIEMNEELKIEITDSLVFVHKDGVMVSAMAAGQDSKIGYYLTVSFPA